MTGVNSLTGDRRVGVVHLVDLAVRTALWSCQPAGLFLGVRSIANARVVSTAKGSERLNKSGSGNDRELLKEAQAINKSLSSLGNVICALAKKVRRLKSVSRAGTSC